jgi:hypothetical protein
MVTRLRLRPEWQFFAVLPRADPVLASLWWLLLLRGALPAVRMADLIVVLDGARLVEVGTHDDLLARNRQYAELYRIQAAAYN